jgi:RNA polymerase sigma-54 factor
MGVFHCGYKPMSMQLALKPQTRLTPQLVMASSLLRAINAEVEQIIQGELADNPALTLVHQRHCSPSLPTSFPPDLPSAADRARLARRSSGDGSDGASELIDRLVDRPSAPDQSIAIQLLQLLDRHGYLRMTPPAAAAELNVDPATVARLIGVLHELEPPGIGAYDLRDCFRIQCAHLAAAGVECSLVSRIVGEVWEDFVNRRWPRVARRLAVSCREVEEAWRFVRANLYPYPLSLLADEDATTTTLATADLIIQRQVEREQVRYSIEIPAAAAYELRISTSFSEYLPLMPGGAARLSTAEQAWVQSYVERARLLITALEQRWATLRQIGQYLVEYQADFLERGPCYLKPLTRSRVAAALGCHESTVSRAVQDKFAQLPSGRLIALSDFFDHSLAAKAVLEQIFARAEQPLSDRLLAERLQAEGIHLARRTVAKYREQLRLPAGH